MRIIFLPSISLLILMSMREHLSRFKMRPDIGIEADKELDKDNNNNQRFGTESNRLSCNKNKQTRQRRRKIITFGCKSSMGALKIKLNCL